MRLDSYLVSYCAPTLAGLKPGSLFRYPLSTNNNFHREVAHCRALLWDRGIRIALFSAPCGDPLVLVYRKQALTQALGDPRAREILIQAGYPGKNLRDDLDFLKRRIKTCSSFPHEIGLFLGYPPEDVDGFIRHKGRCCKYCGCWKVYGDADHAKQQFARFQKCSAVYRRCYKSGFSVRRLTVAA